MAFWSRKKRKSQAEPSAPTAAPGAQPPPPEAPLRLPTQAGDAPLIAQDTLERGALTFDGLAFRPVPIPELVEPFVDPKQPELFGTTNWFFEHLLETLRDASVAGVEDFAKLLLVWRGREHPHFALVYTEGRTVLPVWFESDQLVPWLGNLEVLLQGPCEIHAELTGYKTRKSAFDDQTDLAEFLRANAPAPKGPSSPESSGSVSPPVAAADEPSAPPPPVPEPHPGALVPPKNLGSRAPFIERDGLEPGTISLDGLAFRRVALVDLPPPFIDPDRPERFGEPNYAQDTLIEHLRTAVQPVVDNLELLLIHDPGPEHPHVAFAYSRDRTILPVWFDGQLPAWLTALRGTSGRAFELRVPPSGGYQSGSARHSISPDPATFMVSSAPDRWRGLDDMPAKQELLAEALGVNGRRADVDPAAVAETWRALIDVTGAEPNPPASAADLADFETTTGLALPPELAAMHQVANGAVGAFGMMTMMSLDGMLAQWRSWKQIFDEWPLEELVGHSSCPTEEALGIYTTPRWIPLVDERTGNFAALDLVPGPKGSHGQVIYFGAEESGSIRVLATDLGKFLESQLEYARAEVDRHGEFSSENSAAFYLH